MTTTKELVAGMRMSIPEFLDWPEPEDKPILELDDGILYVAPRPGIAHQSALGGLMYCFLNHLDDFDPPPAEIWHPGAAILSRNLSRVAMPDFAVVLRERASIVVDACIEGAPDIVVEIIDMDRNRDRDLILKGQWHSEAGVPEYWIIDVLYDRVLQLELRDGKYVERGALTADDTLTTPLLPGLEIPLGRIFRHRDRPRFVRE